MRRNVLHVKNFLFWPYEAFRVAMAIQAPTHAKVRGLPRERHLVHASMAGFAAKPFVHVNAVIEINELRQIVHARPFKRLARAVALPYCFQDGSNGPHLRVAIHACLCGWKARKGSRLNSRVTVTAINAQTADMVLMAERHWLLPGNVLHCFIRRSHDHRAQPGNQADSQYGPEKHKPNDGVCSPRKKLGHYRQLL
jgi:hypothetical protein